MSSEEEPPHEPLYARSNRSLDLNEVELLTQEICQIVEKYNINVDRHKANSVIDAPIQRINLPKQEMSEAILKFYATRMNFNQYPYNRIIELVESKDGLPVRIIKSPIERDLTLEDAKPLISSFLEDYLESHEKVYPSDVADELGIRYELVKEVFSILEKEGKLKKEE